MPYLQSGYVWPMRVAVEVCVTDLEGARVALEAGADTVEVCSWLACGGITPSMALARQVAALGRARVLVRVSPGGFRYSPEELSCMTEDAALLLQGTALHGVVVGALDETGLPHEGFLRSVLQRPIGEVTLHRAFDHSSRPLEALDRCLALGVQRLLTSGCSTRASDGAQLLRTLVDRAAGAMAVAAAGGIGPANVVELVERTGVREVHFAAALPLEASPHGVAMSAAHAAVQFATEPDKRKIEGVISALEKAGLR
jgi:copper homeostasis protein